MIKVFTEEGQNKGVYEIPAMDLFEAVRKDNGIETAFKVMDRFPEGKVFANETEGLTTYHPTYMDAMLRY